MTKPKGIDDVYGKKVGDVIKDFAHNVASFRGETLKEDAIVFTDAYSLGNIYFNFDKGKVNMSDVEKHHPQLMDFLTHHPGIGLLVGREKGELVLRGKEGTMAIKEDGSEQLTGKNPLTDYGDEKILKQQITNYMNVKGSGDVVIFGVYDQQKDEVIDFNKKYSLKSLHGGLGGEQTRPFIISKPHIPINGSEITEATQLHDLHDKYKQYLR